MSQEFEKPYVLIRKLDPERSPWLAECELCGIRYPNHAGSTPCCGSVAFIVTDPDVLAAHNLKPHETFSF